MTDLAEAQRGTLLLWMPVALGLGISQYFILRFEPTLTVYIAGAAISAGLLGLSRVAPDRVRPAVMAVALILIGFLNAGWSAHRASAPVLGFRYYGPVQGRIITVDRSASNRPRITLDQVILSRTSPERTPRNVRVSLHYPNSFVTLTPGKHVILTANLSPPASPVEPGGFDFQRHAWFRSLGAIGYSRTPVLEIGPPDQSEPKVRLAALRMDLATAIRARVGGQAGAFAAAILVGDRSAIAPEMLEILRQSNLAHLLAISGLHMGLLTGFVFAAIRYGLALSPYLALRMPVKKIAAGAGLLTALCYLALSGANVATQRAFVMVAVMLLAVLMDRRALTLRAVALAAVIILALRPVSLIEAGFQMSFAATTALVTVFAAMRDRGWFMGGGGFWRGLVRSAITLALSSAIAGAATAPISAFHFNRIAQFGLLANLASVPVMGSLVMPSAVVAVLLAPLGIDGVFWGIMGRGIDWILTVAATIAGMEWAVRHVVKPDGLVLGLISCGALGIVLLRTRVRAIGLVPILVGLMLWTQTTRPDVLLSANGRLLGVNGPEGRSLNRVKGNGFAARSWLENDGDGAGQEQAAHRQRVSDFPVHYNWSKIHEADTLTACHAGDLVILPRAGPVAGDCAQITQDDLKALGAVAIRFSSGTPEITSARQRTGARLWTR